MGFEEEKGKKWKEDRVIEYGMLIWKKKMTHLVKQIWVCPGSTTYKLCDLQQVM